MGFLAKVVAFVRAVTAGEQTPEVRLDLDGGDASTAPHFSAPGDDAPPLGGDVVFLAPGAGTGETAAVGYQDPATVGVAAPGERRLYSRSGPGVMAAEVWLKADGSIVARHALGELALGADGSARVGNALGELAVDAAGVVTWRTPLGQNGAGTHAHATPFGPSGPPIAGT